MALGVVCVGGAPTIFVALGDIFVGGSSDKGLQLLLWMSLAIALEFFL